MSDALVLPKHLQTRCCYISRQLLDHPLEHCNHATQKLSMGRGQVSLLLMFLLLVMLL